MAEQKRKPGVAVLLSFLFIIYVAGVINAILIWANVIKLDPDLWHLESIPAYVTVFCFGGISVLAVSRWKKWGVYGLMATWLATGLLYLLFGQPFPTYGAIYPVILVVVAFFLSLRSIWQTLK